MSLNPYESPPEITDADRSEVASKRDVNVDRGFDQVQRTAITAAMPLLIVSVIFVAILVSCIFSPVAVPSRRHAMLPLLQIALILELLIVGGAISLMALRFYRFASIGILGTVVIVGLWYFFPVLGAYSLVQLLAALPAFVVLQLRDVRDAFGRN